MRVSNISELNLNDSEIVQTRITSDFEIEIQLTYITDYTSQETSSKKLVFRDCHSASLQLNLSYSGPNSILSGEETPRRDGFREFKIITNTTASEIKVVAMHLELLAVS
jgi:hypothetical protein